LFVVFYLQDQHNSKLVLLLKLGCKPSKPERRIEIVFSFNPGPRSLKVFS